MVKPVIEKGEKSNSINFKSPPTKEKNNQIQKISFPYSFIRKMTEQIKKQTF